MRRRWSGSARAESPECQAKSPRGPGVRRSKPGAAPSSGAASQRGASVPGPEAQKDRRGLRQARCGTARGEYRKNRIQQRSADRQPQSPGVRVLRQVVRSTPYSWQGGLRPVCAPCRSLPRKHKKPGVAQCLDSSRSSQERSSQASQLVAEFAGCAEKRIFHRFLGGAECVTDRAELQALIMLHFKNNALARREPLHRASNASLDLFAEEAALGVKRRAMLPLALKKVGNAFFGMAGIQFRGLVFGARLAAAQVVQADVGDDAIEPGVKAAFKAEAVQIPVNLEESFLVDVAGILGPLHEIQGQAQDIAVVAANQFLESGTVSRLRFRHQHPLVKVGQGGHRG